MTFAEIEALPSPAARMAAYRAYVEHDPNHPLAWFNLTVECEAARAYDDARSAAETLRSLDPTLVFMLPDRVRQLLPGNLEPSTIPDHDIGGYRITGVASATESQILYEAVRVTDQMPVTLRRMLDLSHTGARTTFELAVAAPRIEGIARAIGVIEDPERGPLLVLERIRGEPLRGDPRALLDAEVALRLIRSAARNIHALHQAGALHGDLRPESVVRDHSSNEEIVVIGGHRAGAVAPTPRGHLAWRSPEEIAGEVPTTATDVYGLGVLLYHVLTGTEPASLTERAPIRVTLDWPELNELIAVTTARDPATRPRIDGLIGQIDQLLARRDVPRVIGKWRIGRILGEGSFGRVFASENVDISGLHAAVKVLHPFMARDRDMRRRFLNEASAASQINHPGVVRILDGGVEQGGICYVAMELLQGSDLGSRLARGPLALDLAVRLIRDAAHALASTHAQKIVHRDIKPSNFFVELRADGEHLRILDFGIALLRGEPTREGIPYTATGHIWGTPEYMAPEQWQMLRDLDGRVDVYSLGLVLWECLTGRRPFVATTVFEWQQVHLSAPLPHLSDLAPMVPARLAALAERMLAKRREDRIATMNEVVAELDAMFAMPKTYRIAPPPTAATPTAPTEIAVAAPTPPSPIISSRPTGRPLWIVATIAILGLGTLGIYVAGSRNPDPKPAGGLEPTSTTLPRTDCSNRSFLEWGPIMHCGATALVWSYDPARKSCLKPLFTREQLRDELEQLRSAHASGFDNLPRDFQLILYSRGTGIKVLDGEGNELSRASLFVSYRLGSEDRDGGMRLNDDSPVFLSRAGYWCDDSSKVITQAAHPP